MPIESQIEMCTEHYQKWKDQALGTRDSIEARKAMERAFFWLELQTAFIALHSVEQVKGQDREVKRKLIVAKANLSKKLADYAKKILDEIEV
jgi:hypothetical protein